ncbi:hypothetical protein [Burkholderia territorii]|uniref:hypothetical protein n=1 Tax=Burkholderia territorii TaxID=1503055 RepID=UPI000753091E|nr:hypothetical protein [Burkholderia territorii]KWE27764.1 hypothetical protein WT49_28360 [Burkholderia territorii]KWE35830.1 hypothetical protein WT50_24035 [Burkholderia territorii]KWE38258.1 hypothetical protein WT51_30835 [Burkholderia territorii]
MEIAEQMLRKRNVSMDAKWHETKAVNNATQTTRHPARKTAKADHERMTMLVGEAVLKRVQRGEWRSRLQANDGAISISIDGR